MVTSVLPRSCFVYVSNIHKYSLRKLHQSRFLEAGVFWRKRHGLPENFNKYGVLMDTPDWSYRNGTPLAFNHKQMMRYEERKGLAHEVVKLLREIEEAEHLRKCEITSEMEDFESNLSLKLKRKGKKDQPSELEENIKHELQVKSKEINRSKNKLDIPPLVSNGVFDPTYSISTPPLEEVEDLDDSIKNKYHEWMKSEELQELTASQPLTLEKEYEMQQSWHDDEDNSMIGDVNLFFNDPDNKRIAEVEIMIADKENRGYGFGKDVLKVFLRYANEVLNLQKAVAKILMDNKASIFLFLSLGFKEVEKIEVFKEIKYELDITQEWMKKISQYPYMIDKYK